MSDYIRKADAIDEVNHALDRETILFSFVRKVAISALKKMPSADVAPVRHGRWLPIVSYNNTYKCSECGRLLVDITDGLKMVAKHYPYCHCGAKMDGGDEHG
jgi:DNA-directed RNA polymerase subunit RPC12/RpoP